MSSTVTLRRSATPFLFLLAPMTAQTWAPAEQWPIPASGSLAPAAAIVDVDRDGLADLVALGGIQVAVIRGIGTASQRAPETLPIPGAIFARSLEVIDSDGDGDLDIWVGHASGIDELRGDGAGSFAPLIRHPALGGTMALGDVDNDGVLDLLHSGAVGVELARGLGGGAFAAAQALPNTGPQPGWIAIGDLDGDGKLDLATLTGLGGEARTLLGDGLGNFTPSQTFAVGLIGGTIALADVDGDGLDDVLSAGTALQLRRSLGGGALAPAQNLGTPAGTFAIGDCDGDGAIDIALPGEPGFRLLRNNGAGGFDAPQSIPAPFVGRSAAIRDVDQDGRLDLVAINGTTAMLVRQIDPVASGLAPFGTGTASCAGRVGIAGSRVPAIGASDFHVLSTNAPPDAPGLLAIGTALASGWDPLNIGLTLHLGIAVPVATMTSDVLGSARVRLPIPNIGFLAGLRVSAQTVWFEQPESGLACSLAAMPIASSRALRITLQR